MFIKFFKEIENQDLTLIGGKGRALVKLVNQNIPVPNGFIIAKLSYDRKITDDNKVQILKHFSKMKAKKVAVRSSANVEDSLKHSWAGQFVTYLNVSKKDLLNKIFLCLRSVKSKRVKSYSLLEERELTMSVIVQEMVKSEISGVAFSANPVSKNKNHMVIEAASGLGEKLVSGEITPDTYFLYKKPLSIYSKEIIGPSSILTNNQILNLAIRVINIEKLFKKPVDIEWATDNNVLYILQARPITTI